MLAIAALLVAAIAALSATASVAGVSRATMQVTATVLPSSCAGGRNIPSCIQPVTSFVRADTSAMAGSPGPTGRIVSRAPTASIAAAGAAKADDRAGVPGALRHDAHDTVNEVIVVTVTY